MPMSDGHRRIAVVGSTGAGKTALARRLAARLGLPHIELDAIHWGPGWSERPLEEFRAQVAEIVRGERWILDGNYRKARDLIWSRADTLVWLDYPLWLVLWRLVRRTLRRIITREKLWHGNREHWNDAFLGRDSLILWALRSHGRLRQQYPALLQQPEFAHLHVVQLRSSRETERWLAQLDQEATSRG